MLNIQSCPEKYGRSLLDYSVVRTHLLNKDNLLLYFLYLSQAKTKIFEIVDQNVPN